MNVPTFTSATIEDNAIAYKYKIRKTSKLIYGITLTVIAAALGALPLVKLRISINSTGVIESSTEKIQILSPVGGKVIFINLKDNQKVKLGDTLLVFDASLPKEQINLLQNQKETLGDQLQDVNTLLNSNTNSNIILKTGEYQASWQQFQLEMENSKLAKDQAERNFKRFQALHLSKVITDVEFEKYEIEYRQAVLSYDLISKRYRSQWQLEANGYRKESKQLNSQQADLKDQRQKYILKATVDGSIQNLNGIQFGTYVFSNQNIAEISPDTKLLAFCYIKPADVGLIFKGQHVNFQVGAFNYNQWGSLTGKVLDISDDIITMSNNQPMFKVKCQLDKNFLQLKNGYKGYIKKGMGFSARVLVTKRSLFQLLFDKVDDWLNPGVTNMDK